MNNSQSSIRGVTTLAFAISGLLLMTISVLLMNRQIHLLHEVQQRTYQHEQARQIAEATVVKVQNKLRLASWRDIWISDPDQDGWLGVASSGQALQFNQWNGRHKNFPDSPFRVLFTNPIRFDFNYLQLEVEVCYSALCAVKAHLQQTLKLPANYTPPNTPLTVLNALELDGQVSLVHASDRYVATVRGSTLKISSSVEITDLNGTRRAKLSGDPAIRVPADSPSADQFFRQLMGLDQQAWQRACPLLQCPSGCNAIQLSAVLQQASCIWVKGDLNLSGYQEYGSQQAPLLMVVEGDLRPKHNTVLNGLVYLKSPHSQFNGQDAWQLNGALVAEGKLEINAPVKLSYQKQFLDAIPQLEMSVPVSGTWNDARF